MDYGLVNAFLSCGDLDSTETLLRDNVVRLNEMFERLTGEREEAAGSFQRKEQELLKISGALENQLAMVEHLARTRGLEPLQPPPTQDEEERTQEQE